MVENNLWIKMLKIKKKYKFIKTSWLVIMLSFYFLFEKNKNLLLIVF